MEATAFVFEAAGKPLLQRKVLVSDVESEATIVEVTGATICGSDVHTIEGKRNEPAPLVLGHEGVGVVCSLNNPAYPPGTRVSWAVGLPTCTQTGHRCSSCDSRVDMPQKCRSVFKYGHTRWEGKDAAADLSGTYASHIVLRPGSAVVPLTGSLARLPDAVVAPANCALATMVCAIERACQLHGDVKPQSMLIQGAGLLGLYGTALAAEACWDEICGGGATAVGVTDTVQSRLDTARQFGATIAVNVAGRSDDDVRAELLAHLKGQADMRSRTASQGKATQVHGSNADQELPEPMGYDVVIEVCGHAGVLPLGLSLLRPGGVYVLVGLVHPQSSLAGLTAESLIRKCAVMAGVHNYAPRHLEEGLRFLDRHYRADGEVVMPEDVAHPMRRPLPFTALVSSPLPLSQIEQGVALAKQGRWPRVLLVPGLAEDQADAI